VHNPVRQAEAVQSQSEYPRVRQVVLDATDIGTLAEFYHQLVGYEYRPGDEPPADPGADTRQWIVLRAPSGATGIAFQLVGELKASTWPEQLVPQQLHLDLTVATKAQLDAQHRRALALGARMLLDRSDDMEEPLRVYADPAGHPFCIFVAP